MSFSFQNVTLIKHLAKLSDNNIRYTFNLIGYCSKSGLKTYEVVRTGLENVVSSWTHSKGVGAL